MRLGQDRQCPAPRPGPLFAGTRESALALKTFVIDTSVLLSDPHALRNFAEHSVVVPIVVITELEAKRHHPELGYFARTALRDLDDLRIRYGRLDAPIPVNEVEGTLRVELNHTDPEVLPPGFRLGDNDSRILAVALNYRAEGNDVVLVSKDLPMRVKASAVGLAAEEYRHETHARLGLDRHGRGGRDRRRRSSSSTPRAAPSSPRRSTCPATPASCCTAPARPRSDGCCPTAPSVW